ncbi:hypothetical protein E1B28_003349 [Marasmius oreades]|uniref:MYND-type domain-containing protein n=1 Tax=Marasmius oreades TaxID=181124 RepID=A0A9P7RL91_9AGAR|nr:uncharacterized protein E1B28_003349 [Marasmius oreades]KAG7085811.1 hypothetical protein E1B28_003349 [Marasmius oreades]
MSIKNEELHCFTCRKTKAFKDLKRCGRCKGPLYCSPDCQKKDWPSHKANCATTSVWYDGYRACQDGSLHEGELELITWECYEPDFGLHLGWGGCFREESEDLKRKFEKQFNGDLKKFFNYRPNAFRWRCCGMSGDQQYGCDHHGAGKKPCTCDFCRMGKPLTDSIYRKVNQARMGLNLRRGPDPRSYNASLAVMSEIGRSMLGLDD